MDILSKIDLFLKEDITSTAGTKRHKTLKALLFMSENLDNEEVKTVLKSLECKGCKNKDSKKIIESLKELVSSVEPSDYVVTELYKVVKKFSY